MKLVASVHRALASRIWTLQSLAQVQIRSLVVNIYVRTYEVKTKAKPKRSIVDHIRRMSTIQIA